LLFCEYFMQNVDLISALDNKYIQNLKR